MCIVSTATPAIASHFNSLIDISWYGGAYQLGSSAHFNTNQSFLTFAVSSPMFIVGRAIAGAGSSGIGNGAMTIVSAALPVQKRAKFLWLNLGMGQVGIALGPILGGAFTVGVSFYINLSIGGALAVFLFFFKVSELTPKLPLTLVLGTAIQSLDLPVFMLISSTVIMFLLRLQHGRIVHPWNSATVISLLVSAGVTFILFLTWEYHQGDGNLFLLLGVILVAEYYLAIYSQTVLDNNAIISGVYLLPTTLGLVSFTMLSKMMIEILGYYLPWNVAGAALAAIAYGLVSMLEPTSSTAQWVGYQILYGIGSGAMSSASGLYVSFTANLIFTNGLRNELQRHIGVIGVDPERKDGERLAAALRCYTTATEQVMYLGVGVSVATFGLGSVLGWVDIRKINGTQAVQADVEDGTIVPLPCLVLKSTAM
ncbi:hypothetical protein BDW74DRAFT_165848 [Aspergillus multicolor]|uniref:uncharacterized protein n=1 Tax=Aspergillus multicolor TaxID=41759 RepID=UPI003CCDEC45